MADSIESVIRFVSLYHNTKKNDSMDLKGVLFRLFELKDMFQGISEYGNE